MNFSLILILPEIIVLLGAVLVFMLDLAWRDGRRERVPWVALGVLVAAGLSTIGLWGREEPIFFGMMAVDPFAVYFKLVAFASTGLVVLASKRYFALRCERRGEVYGLLLFAVLASILATSANDLISLYLAFEFLSLTCYVLVSYLRGDLRSSEAGVKYFLYGAVTSAIMLYGMSLIYGATGTTSLEGIADRLLSSASAIRWLAIPTTIMLIAGFSFKAGLAPFHQWIPDTYEGAPTPITSFLSVASKMTGFAVMLRVMVVAMGDFQPTWARVLGAFAIVGMVLGNLVALQQSDIKRMLAYSSVAHAGCITIGLVTYVMGPRPFNGLNGVLLYGMVYLFTNLGVFLAAIAFENATGSTAISDYAGLARRSPILAWLLAYLLLSLLGAPLTGGMFAKLFVFAPAVQAGPFGVLLAGVGIATSVVAAFYYLNIVRHMFFMKGSTEEPVAVSVGVKVGLIIAVVVTFLIGVYPQPLVSLASRSVLMLGAAL